MAMALAYAGRLLSKRQSLTNETHSLLQAGEPESGDIWQAGDVALPRLGAEQVDYPRDSAADAVWGSLHQY